MYACIVPCPAGMVNEVCAFPDESTGVVGDSNTSPRDVTRTLSIVPSGRLVVEILTLTGPLSAKITSGFRVFPVGLAGTTFPAISMIRLR